MYENRYEPDPDRSPEGYNLVEEPALQGPPLPGAVVVAPTADELIDAVAADLVVHAEQCVRQFGDFHLALSGGSTPQPLYDRLMYDPNYRSLPWRRTHLWIVDERCVPFDHPRSNFRGIRETIVDHADIPPEQVHPIFAMNESADEEYERALREALMWRERGEDRLDYVLLGMGADGHTASLFPFSEALGEDQRWVHLIESPSADPPRRVTMTYPLLNHARYIVVLVTGAAKAETIARAAEGHEGIERMPIKGIAPQSGQLKWYLDAAAAGIMT